MFDSIFCYEWIDCKSSYNSSRINCKSSFLILGAWWDIWKQPLFGTKEEEEEDDDDNNTSINMLPNNEGEKAKGGWVLCNFFFGVLFYDGFFFSFTFLSSL